jgi:uncharacterized protein YbaR (Trm112 family)
MIKKSSATTTDRFLLTKLVCPVTGGPLAIAKTGEELISRSAKLGFPIRDGIPILVISEARELTQADLKV